MTPSQAFWYSLHTTCPSIHICSFHFLSQLYSLLCMVLITQLYHSIAFYVRTIYIRSNLSEHQNWKLIILRQEGNKKIVADKAKPDSVNCQRPPSKHLCCSRHTWSNAQWSLEIALMKEMVRNSQTDGCCRTSVYHFSRCYLYSFHWDGSNWWSHWLSRETFCTALLLP